MATITPTRNAIEYGTEIVSWTGLSTADTGTAIFANKTSGISGFMQVTGTFGGATIVLQGSNDNTNWVTLKDVTASNLSFSAAGGADFSTAAAYIRPSSSGGTGDDVTVTLTLRGL
jgi:hypothetical protein